MKKVFIILFLFFSCYFIYQKTETKKLNYISIGDSISLGVNEYGVRTKGYNDYVYDYLKENCILKSYDNTFSLKDCYVSDIKRILMYNEKINNKSLNRLIKKADIITINIGMDEINNKINNNIINVYSYLDNMINDYDKILKYMSKFNHNKVIIIGYYSPQNKYNDIFNYSNYKLEKICDKYNFTFINLESLIGNNPLYLNKNSKFLPNSKGYKIISQKIVEKIKKC